ncbi:MAG: hypothetical protein NT076_01555 [Candidatus Pacearchaeota archaeon]|nr:hypothetical protein [Candidatus Pacearchaeota archaeon]
MSFFSRKKSAEELPELPELPKLPEFPAVSKAKTELPPLPSFPEEQEEITNRVVKYALTQEIEPDELESQISEVKVPSIKQFTREPRETSLEPIFVRIDRYQESKENLQEVKRKILEIESLLRDIKDIKSREDSQLQEWDSDIQEAKAKLDKIDKIMFQKM